MSLPTSSSSNDNLIYLFSSAPPDRPDYKRGVLNALCYPAGHLLKLNYRRDYFQPSLFDGRERLRGRRAVFVFIDYRALTATNDHDFIPIRFLRLLDVSPKEEAENYLETTRVYIRVELGEFIFSTPTSSTEIGSIPDRPRPYNGNPGEKRNYFYVVEGANKFSQPNRLSQQDTLDHMIQRVAKSDSLSSCVFLSTGNVQPFKNGKPVCGLVEYGEEQKAYRLQTNNIYRLDLRVFDPKRASGSRYEIAVRSSSDFIAVSQPFSIALGGPIDHSALLVCKRTTESTLATLEVEVKGVRTSAGGEDRTLPGNALGDVIAAEPVYLLDIRPAKWVLPAFVILVFVGVLSTSTSPEFFKEFEFLCYPQSLALVCKTLGAGALAAAAYLAFRKLPSGGGNS